MNRTYFKFLFSTTIKKRPVWITWVIFLLAISAFIIVLPAVTRVNTLQVWANTAMTICESFVGMAVAIFTSILGIHTFKDGLEDGTELIIISKPISRSKLVLTKFFVFGTMCLIVNLSAVLITLFTIFIPSTEVKFYWQLILSMFIGNLIGFAVFGSIACLLTLKFAKVGVIVVNVLISLIIIIYQCLTLFCFSTPAKSLLDHGMKAPSYILIDRNMTTGDYKEDEVVRFDTLSTNQFITFDDKGKIVINEQANKSKNWREMSEYWTGQILKKNPTKWLNWTDIGSQLALTYLSGGLNGYAHRQANRAFALSRYYDYKLTSPASPEIKSGVTNKKSLSWAYTSFNYDLNVETAAGVNNFLIPTGINFPGISPLGSTRLRGYGDKIPVGHYVKAGEILATKDVFFEQDQWKKYKKPFEVMYQNIFDYRQYIAIASDTDPLINFSLRPNWWSMSNKNLEQYYNLAWGCFTGRASEYAKPEAVESTSALTALKASDFDVTSIDDVNERFLQFKNYVALRAIEDQQKCFNEMDELEKPFVQQVLNATDYQTLMAKIGIKMSGTDTWYAQADLENPLVAAGLLDPYIEPNTQIPLFDLIKQTMHEIIETIKDSTELSTQEKQDIVAYTRCAEMFRTAGMITDCSLIRENFLFDSMDKPNRSASHRGVTYVIDSDWNSYWDTMLSLLGVNGERCVGQNMQWFFYETKDTVNYMMYTLIWLGISIGLFAAAAITYHKYDVK